MVYFFPLLSLSLSLRLKNVSICLSMTRFFSRTNKKKKRNVFLSFFPSSVLVRLGWPNNVELLVNSLAKVFFAFSHTKFTYYCCTRKKHPIIVMCKFEYTCKWRRKKERRTNVFLEKIISPTNWTRWIHSKPTCYTFRMIFMLTWENSYVLIVFKMWHTNDTSCLFRI